MGERMLPLSEVERALGLTRWSIWGWIQQGKIKAVKLPNGHYRISESEVQRVLKDRSPVAV